MANYTDVFIIGGGINGTAIAADAAGRGLSVTLCEKNDLASGTSSVSSKLIHGGLRYLEQYEFNLVRKALIEREILLHRAPHLIKPLEFVLPHEKHLRHAWIIRMGLFVYDHLAFQNHLPHAKSVNLLNDPRGQPLLSHLKKGFSYYDCSTDDARLVILNALSAKENNATILTRMAFVNAAREENHWSIQLRNTITNQIENWNARVLMNIAGPWVKMVQKNIVTDMTFDINLVQGSHIILPKLYEGDFAYILQNQDQRIVFVIPFKKRFTLIGTTDVIFKNNLDQVEISDAEKIYLCDLINQYFKQSLSIKDIRWAYSGVRCLQATHEKNPSEITRDYKLILENKNQLPLLTVIGGKLTTHRVLAEEAVNQLKPYFKNMGPAWTAKKPLPGGDMAIKNLSHSINDFKQKFPWLPGDICERYFDSYGTRAERLLNNFNQLSDLGAHFGSGLYQNEVDYLIKEEWAKTTDDILWRRSKLGLFFSEEQKEKLNQYLMSYS